VLEFFAVFEVAEFPASFGIVPDDVVPVSEFAEPPAFADSGHAFEVLVHLSVAAVEGDTFGRPKSFAFPNIEYYTSFSSSVEIHGKGSVYSSTGILSNYGSGGIVSIPGLSQNKTTGYRNNNPSPGHNNVSDTNGLPMDATTNHSRKTSLHLYQAQSRHRKTPASLPHTESHEIQWEEEKFQRL